ncbi:hypothetical protein DFH28DRAFT_888056 [Melampsora americana]|nr:hypothetical protein DFH28DRAFT_888056 [Melampsora americana]
MRQDFCFIRLLCNLQRSIQAIFKFGYPHGSLIEPRYLFSLEQLWVVIVNNHLFAGGILLDKVFGTEPLPKSYDSILDQINIWRAGPDSKAILHPTTDEYSLHEQAVQEAMDLDALQDGAKGHQSQSTRRAILKDNINQVCIYLYNFLEN